MHASHLWRFLLAASALVALALPSRPAGAQPYADPGTGAGVIGAISRSPDASASSAAFSAHVLTRLTGAVGVELAAGYREERYAVTSDGLPHDLNVWEIPVQLSLLFYLVPNARVQPYLLGGGAYYRVNVEDVGPSGDTVSTGSNKFGLHVGAGVDIRVASRVSLRADGRYVFLDVDAVSAYGKTANYWQAGLGLNVYF